MLVKSQNIKLSNMKYIFITFYLIINLSVQSQSLSDKYHIHRSLKLYQKGKYDKSKEVLQKVKEIPSEIKDKEQLFKYLYTEKYNRTFKDYLINYNNETKLDTLIIGLNEIVLVINLWNNEELSKNKIVKKYNIHDSDMLNIKKHLDSLIKVKETRDSLYQDSLMRVLLAELKNKHSGNVLKSIAENLNYDTLKFMYGKEFATKVQFSFTQEFDGKDMKYIFDVSYGGNYFTPGTYMNDTINFIISSTIDFIRVDMMTPINNMNYANFYKIILTGTADASLPRTVRYSKNSKNWGNIPNGRAKVNGKIIKFSLKKNQLISNLEIAYLRAYNVGRLFKEKDYNQGQINAIDYWNQDRAKKGEKYRSARYIFIILDFNETYMKDLNLDMQKEIFEYIKENPTKHHLEYNGMYITNE